MPEQMDTVEFRIIPPGTPMVFFPPGGDDGGAFLLFTGGPLWLKYEGDYDTITDAKWAAGRLGARGLNGSVYIISRRNPGVGHIMADTERLLYRLPGQRWKRWDADWWAALTHEHQARFADA
jgi:hypothetical protein